MNVGKIWVQSIDRKKNRQRSISINLFSCTLNTSYISSKPCKALQLIKLPPSLSPPPPQRPETGGRDRDRQLSYISNRARPFGNDDSSSSSSSAPAGANPPSRGFPGSTSSSSSSAASHQRQSGVSARLPPSTARNNGFRSKSEDLGGSSGSSGHHQQNETNNGSSSSGSGSSSRFTKPTPRANRYRSTTTAEPVTAKSTTVESVVLRNRFAGR